jgi:hypothetical protein
MSQSNLMWHEKMELLPTRVKWIAMVATRDGSEGNAVYCKQQLVPRTSVAVAASESWRVLVHTFRHLTLSPHSLATACPTNRAPIQRVPIQLLRLSSQLGELRATLSHM